jgi:hypothetical protein
MLVGLQELSLRDNSLTSSVPSELGGLTQLQTLDLSANSLTGYYWPSALSRVEHANLSSNSFLVNNCKHIQYISSANTTYCSIRSYCNSLPHSPGDADVRASGGSRSARVNCRLGVLWVESCAACVQLGHGGL